VLLYERRQRQNMIRKLEVIRMMNHHVRNSLQVISFAASVPEQEEIGNNLRDAVERIEWALREVLPGQERTLATCLCIRTRKTAHSDELHHTITQDFTSGVTGDGQGRLRPLSERQRPSHEPFPSVVGRRGVVGYCI
jgi:light-regulated signal transduction histidine kinase (bacteriophytochrome)